MVQWLNNLIGNSYVTTLIISLIPTLELKGGILFARSSGIGFWAALGLTYLGSMAVFFLVYFLLKPILRALKKTKWFSHFASKVENYFAAKAEKSVKDGKGSADKLKMLSLFVFVAIPLPLTGVWTGSAIAAFLNLDFKKSFASVAAGNLVAGIIISILAEVCRKYVDYILYGFFALAALSIIIVILKVAFTRTKKEKTDDTNIKADENNVNKE